MSPAPVRVAVVGDHPLVVGVLSPAGAGDPVLEPAGGRESAGETVCEGPDA